MKIQMIAPSMLALFVASAAHAGATFDTAAGTLNLVADIEFDYTSETHSNLFSGGRLLLDINGSKVLENGNFAAFKLNPVWGQNGSAGADDIWIKFGVQNNWALQSGHFEAADLSPAGQDTYIASSGTTMYRANFARGRTDENDDNTGADGQMTFTKTLGDRAGFELTAQSRNDGDTLMVRPVVTYAMDSVSMVLGAEFPVAAKEDSSFSITGDTSDKGKNWVGFGGAATLQATDELALTARAAYLADNRVDTNEVEAMTAGINAQYQHFFISALYGKVDADVNTDDTKELQIYASYKIPTVLDIDNFAIYLGAAWSEADINGVTQDDVMGGRVRLKYIF